MSETNELLNSFRKSYGEKAKRGSDLRRLTAIPTGSLSLDFAIGVGGFPRGLLTELYGRPKVGKTTLLYHGFANAQQMGLGAALIDFEGKFDPDWASRVAGVNVNELIVLRPSDGEEAVEMLIKVIHSGSFGIVGFDSIGGIIGRSEIGEVNKKGEIEVGSDRVGGQAKLITGMQKRVNTMALEKNIAVVYINQVRAVIGARVAGVVDSPGGYGFQHGLSLRIEIKAKGDADSIMKATVDGQKDKRIGYRVAAEIKSNQVSAPFRTAAWDFYHDEVSGYPFGIDTTQEILDLGIQLGIIDSSTQGSYRYDGFPDGKIRGKDNLREFLVLNPELEKALKDEIRAYSLRKQREKEQDKLPEILGN